MVSNLYDVTKIDFLAQSLLYFLLIFWVFNFYISNFHLLLVYYKVFGQI